MKNIIYCLFVAVFFVSCNTNSNTENNKKTDSLASVNSILNYKIDTSASIIEWRTAQKKILLAGNIKLKDGNITVEHNQITKGNFVFDMNSILIKTITDKSEYKKLIEYLKSKDFFFTDSFPEAEFKITEVEQLPPNTLSANGMIVSHRFTGDLKIKTISKSVTFDGKVQIDSAGIVAIAPAIAVDRSEWIILTGKKNKPTTGKPTENQILFNIKIKSVQ